MKSEAASATDHEAVWRRGCKTPRARAHTHTHTQKRACAHRVQTTAHIGGRGRVAKVAVCCFSTVATQQSLSTRGASTPIPHTHSWQSATVACRTRAVTRLHNYELQM